MSELRCFICGDDNPHVLETHHAVPKWIGGSDKGQNIYTLCRNCHSCVEQIYDEAFWDRLADAVDRHPAEEPLTQSGSNGRPPTGLQYNEAGELVVGHLESFHQRAKVIMLKERGWTNREVEDKLDVPKSTVSEIWNRCEVYKQAVEDWPPIELDLQATLSDSV